MHLNKKIITGVGGGIVLIAIAAGLIIDGKKKAVQKHITNEKITEANTARPITLGRVEKVSSPQTRTYPGIIQAAETSALSFRVGGPLTDVNVQLGQPAKKGDLLMQIDPRDFKDRIQALEAQLDGAIAQQKKITKDYARFSSLFEQAVIPQSDFDNITSAQDAANAAVKALNAQLQIARHALEDTSLRAPYNGTVTKQLVENNEMVKAGTVVLHYHNIQQLEITVSISANEIAQHPLTTDTTAHVFFPAMPNKKITARLKEWSSEADPLTRTYAATFTFDAPVDCTLLPGMSAHISFEKSASTNAMLTIPAAALNTSSDGNNFVWVYQQATSTAVRRPIQTGELYQTDRLTVRSGLTEGEQVVASGNRLIHENQPLTIANIR